MKKKITNIKFLTKNEILVTTNDNRIRIMNINDGSVIQKFKGHKNMEGMLKCDFCENYEVIISPSEDGYVYLWNIEKKRKLDIMNDVIININSTSDIYEKEKEEKPKLGRKRKNDDSKRKILKKTLTKNLKQQIQKMPAKKNPNLLNKIEPISSLSKIVLSKEKTENKNKESEKKFSQNKSFITNLNKINTFNYDKKIIKKSEKSSQNNLLNPNKNSYSSNEIHFNVKNLKKSSYTNNNSKKELSKYKSLNYLYGNLYSNNHYLNINFNNYMNYNFNYSNRHEDKKNLDFKFKQSSDRRK